MTERPTWPVAHTPMEGSDEWHDLDKHSLEVARFAAEFAAPFGGDSLAWWAGLLHDPGKLLLEFQEYLWQSYIRRPKKQKSVDHKSAGAYIGCFRFAGYSLGQILHGHHGGLSNRTLVEGKLDALRSRDDTMEALWREFAALPKIAAAIDGREPLSLPPWVDPNDKLQMEVLIRMLFSCLVDSDWLDTERHRDRANHLERQHPLPTIDELLSGLAENQAKGEFVDDPMLAGGDVGRVRAEVFQSAVKKSSGVQGFYRLSAPTGSGKTRSGIAFALHHAKAHHLRRIIVAVPYLTITDQTANSYRGMFGSDAVLEHHSGIDPDVPDPDGRETPDEHWRELACQNWGHPLVVTTTVQLFESLFSNTTSACRKLHNIAASVILIDEAQTLPARMREPLFDMLLELVTHYRVTVLLTTATQPALDTIEQSLEERGMKVEEIVPDPSSMFQTLKRVNYYWPNGEIRTWAEIADELSRRDQALAVVNSIGDASTLYGELGNGEDTFYLSTRLCQAHRRDILRRIRAQLDTNQPCTVVSTQLIEAGVDISFPVVFRALASFDRIVQAAGRCNREGELDQRGDVFVFDPGPNGSMPPGDYRLGANVTEILLRAGELDPDDPESLTGYFSTLYRYVPPDAKEIQAKRLRHDFVDVRKAAKLIDDDTFRVYVPYVNTVDGDCSEAEQEARHADRLRALRDPSIRGKQLRELMREAQRFLVNCDNRDREQYAKDTTIIPINDWLWEWRDNYDEQTGLQPGQLRPELLIV